MGEAMDCLFCKIADKSLPTQCVYEDEQVMAFEDINPQAAVHFLIIPKQHITSINQIEEAQAALLAHLLLTAKKLAKSHHLDNNGYRLVINTNDDGGQTVYHLHIHLLGGRKLTWPPG